jgi:hypothetical protein
MISHRLFAVAAVSALALLPGLAAAQLAAETSTTTTSTTTPPGAGYSETQSQYSVDSQGNRVDRTVVVKSAPVQTNTTSETRTISDNGVEKRIDHQDRSITRTGPATTDSTTSTTTSTTR